MKALEGTRIGAYLAASREPAYSLLFLVPLLLIYEGLAVIVNFNHPVEIRNGADVILRDLLHHVPVRLPPLAVLIFLVVVVAALVSHLRGGAKLEARYFGVMMGESVAWAFVMAGILKRLLGILANPGGGGAGPPGGPLTKLMLFLGAGVYEEIVFRVLLVSALMVISQRMLRLGFRQAVAISVVGSALLFSGFHHVGPFGDPFSVKIFLFRFLAGLFLSGLYVARGLGIAAWSHALYDIFTYLQLT